MVVRIRLARFGRRNLPFYRIFVADSRSPRDGRHIEVVGHFDPITGKDGNKHLGLNFDRIKYWLSVGAQPSDRVARLLGQVGVLPMQPRPFLVDKTAAPRPERTEPPAAAATAAPPAA